LESQKRPVVLVAATVWWPASARVAMRLIEYGCRVMALCPRGHVLSQVGGMDRVYTYRRLDSLRSFEAAIRDSSPEWIIPCDDRVVWQMHDLHQRLPDLRPLIEGSLGPSVHYDIVRCRERLLETARSLAIRVPETNRVHSESTVREWFAHTAPSAVLKRDGTWGGDGVQIVHSEEQALVALRKLSRRLGMTAASKRMLVNRDPVALWEWREHVSPVITIQRLIPGRPANALLACWRGELLGMLVVEVLSSQGATGAALVVRAIENQEIRAAAERLTERLELSGFCGLDFMLAAETGVPYLIEMNPRCTQLGHLALGKPSDLTGLLYAKMTGRSEPPYRVPIDNEIVAFFPQAVVWTPQSPFIRSGYHDVPWEQPQLVRELLREPWPDRQWSARLYHRLRPIEKLAAVEFTGVPA
jgi:ATP-grasp domain